MEDEEVMIKLRYKAVVLAERKILKITKLFYVRSCQEAHAIQQKIRQRCCIFRQT